MIGSRLYTLHSWVALRASPSILAGGVLLWLASALGVAALQSRVASLTNGSPVPDVMVFYAPRELYALLEQYGSAGRNAFLQFTVYDIFYPFVAYGVAILAIVYLTRGTIQSQLWVRWFLVLPLAGLIVELVEQACFLAIVVSFPTRMPCLAALASALTLCNFALISTLVLSVIVLAFWRVGSRAA